MTESVVIEARSLIDKVSSDPIAYYPSLLHFSKKYNLGTDIHKEVILLGSIINDLIETDPDNIRTKEYRENIYLKWNDIINRINNQHNLKVHFRKIEESYTIKQKFLDQKPEEKTIFFCKDISRKISDDFSLNNISLDLRLGEITGLVGENGNGKTSLLRIIAGELKANRGSLQYNFSGAPCNNWIEIKRSIGYVKQTLLPWRGVTSVREQLKFTAAMKGITGINNEAQYDFIISRLNLEGHQNKLWNELSGGYRLRFELARQLIWQPKLLILDEPLGNLDIKSQLTFLQDLRNLTNSISNSMAVIISSQNLYEVEKISDHVVFMRNGSAVYNGHVADIGAENKYRCYEIDTSASILDLQNALRNLQVKEIRREAFYKLIFTHENIQSADIMQELGKRDIPVLYFRDITHSTRLLFEK
ncbi:ABC transporter ATP-binding protein [Niastella caeni]|uniref:ABC transporter ATP-binding protein n=1 Tax=Niastella caeni TaxID=2569763 RepID=A0A4S8HYF9_9BACT|nr:ABC transporter ATP-binding protein [Niastella caeni]THU40767.1 ABC transporter ATP-binding protein [Niastella caeni]